MTARAVLDVNVLVSGVLGLGLGRTTPPVIALITALQREYVLVASPPLLDEFHAVLQRPRFALGTDLATQWAELIGSVADVVPAQGRLHILKRDPTDNTILECALRGRAESLVTGNLRHFEELRSEKHGEITYRGVRVVTPRGFVRAVLGR